MAQKALWGWYPAGNVWVKLQVSATGQLVIDPTAIFDDTHYGIDGDLLHAPTSNVMFDHNDLPCHKDIGARVYDDAVQSIPSGISTAINFAHERYDTDTIHDVALNNTRLTCKTAGKYIIVGQLAINILASKTLWVSIRLNGGFYICVTYLATAPADSLYLVATTIHNLVIGDYIELTLYHTNGVNTNTIIAANYVPEFMMQRIG